RYCWFARFRFLITKKPRPIQLRYKESDSLGIPRLTFILGGAGRGLMQSGRSPQLVFKLSQDAFDFSLRSPARIAVPAFKQDTEVVAPTVDFVEIARAEFSPVVVDFISEMLPLGFENVLFHFSTSP